MAQLIVGGITVDQLDRTLAWEAGLAVDGDGAATAYAPDRSGLQSLDDLANAGRSGDWWGLVTDNGHADGKPIAQGHNDPAPGFYVSTTALVNASRPRRDPRRYVDALTVPYLAIPPELEAAGAQLGDVAIVVNRRNGAQSPAIVADIGPRRKVGEESIALATALGLDGSPRKGGASSGILCVIFCGSRQRWPRSVDDFGGQAASLFAAWGGAQRATTSA